MKRFFLLLIFFVFFIVLSNQRPIYGQVPSPTPTLSLMPGLDCGNPSATEAAKKKCCYYQPINTQTLFPTKPNLPVADQLIDGLNSVYQQIIRPIADPLNRVAQTTIQPCMIGTPSTPGNPSDPNCTCIIPTTAPLAALTSFCNNVSGGEKGDCTACINKGAVWTGLGCIYPNVKDFIEKTLLSFGIGLAGVISLLCIIYAAFTLQTSQGNPERVKKAQELLTSCIMGLMLIIFAVFILRLIGVDILRIPGLGG